MCEARQEHSHCGCSEYNYSARPLRIMNSIFNSEAGHRRKLEADIKETDHSRCCFHSCCTTRDSVNCSLSISAIQVGVSLLNSYQTHLLGRSVSDHAPESKYYIYLLVVNTLSDMLWIFSVLPLWFHLYWIISILNSKNKNVTLIACHQCQWIWDRRKHQWLFGPSGWQAKLNIVN
jgi:hypothetical protein